MFKKVLTIALAITFALALTLSLGGCKDKNADIDEDDSAWEDDGDLGIDEEDDDADVDDIDINDEIDWGDEGPIQFFDDGEWPDNEYTRQIPKPDFDVGDCFLDDGEFTVYFLGMTMEDSRKYSDQLQAAGFNKNLTVIDASTWSEAFKYDPDTSNLTEEQIAQYLAEHGMKDDDFDPTFNFEADNDAGYHLEFYWDDTPEILVSISKL